MLTGIFYVLSVLTYGILAVGLAYASHKIVPLLTFSGSLIFGGLFFFIAVFLHEMTLYRRHKLQLKLAQNSLVKEHSRLIERIDHLHHRLSSLLTHQGKAEGQTLLEKNLNDLKGKISQTPQKTFQLLDLYVSVLGVLIDRLGEGNPLSSFTSRDPSPRREPTLSIPQETRPPFSEGRESHFFPRSMASPLSPLEEKKASPSLTAPSLSPLSPSFTPLEIASHLHEGVRQDRIEVTTFPIVNLPQRKTMLYQCLPQIRCANGWVINYEEFHSIAEQEQLAPYIDHATLSRVVQWAKTASYKQPHLRYLCATSFKSLQAKDFISSFVDFAALYPQISSRLLFQVPGSLFSRHREQVVPILQKCTLEGLSFATNTLESFDGETLKALVDCRIQFIMLPAQEVLKTLQKDPQGTTLLQLHRQLESYGIDIIVTNVTDEKTILLLLDLGIGYASGSVLEAGDGEAKRRA